MMQLHTNLIIFHIWYVKKQLQSSVFSPFILEVTSNYCNYIKNQDDVDETELRKMEDARQAYVAAVTTAKEREDEESLAMAAKARAYLQSLAFKY